MNTPARTFQDLVVWQKAHQLVLAVYKLTAYFPDAERFSQLRRSAVSIPANIAEGFKKTTLTEKARFFNIAQSSLEESRYYLILANDLNYCKTASIVDMLEETSRLLNAYYTKLKSRKSSDS